MRIKFDLNVEPFSVNRTYYRDRRVKTQDFRDWELQVIQALNRAEPQAQLAKLRSAFDAKKHGFVVKFDFYFPKSVLYNKQGLISSRAEDLSNVEKPLLDLVFLPKYHVQAFPWGCHNVNADDKSVLRLVSSKLVALDGKFRTTVSIKLVNLAAHP